MVVYCEINEPGNYINKDETHKLTSFAVFNQYCSRHFDNNIRSLGQKIKKNSSKLKSYAREGNFLYTSTYDQDMC